MIVDSLLEVSFISLLLLWETSGLTIAPNWAFLKAQIIALAQWTSTSLLVKHKYTCKTKFNCIFCNTLTNNDFDVVYVATYVKNTILYFTMSVYCK